MPETAGVKVRVSGVIVREGKLLTMVHLRQSRRYHVLPGGGLDLQESIPDCLRRELKEETSLSVEPGRLLAIVETVPARLTSYYRDNRHVVELVHWVTQVSGETREIAALSVPAWVPAEEIESLNLYPRINHWLVHALTVGFPEQPAHFVFPVEPVGTASPFSLWPESLL
jgi:ADP-ribose pyrophosphatase YjhB (NUDIX family)